MKVTKIISVVAFIYLSGCSTISSISKNNVTNAHKLAADNSGITYGAWLNGGTEKLESVIEACKAIDNADPRCATPEKYRLGNALSAMGFAAGGAGPLTLQPVELNLQGCITGSSKCTYVKVLSEKDKFGTILEIASVPGDKKCHWSGLPRAGGVVCPAYKWNYRENLNSWDTFNGKMSIDSND